MLIGGLTIMHLGMGIVFFFLTIMYFSTILLSFCIEKYHLKFVHESLIGQKLKIREDKEFPLSAADSLDIPLVIASAIKFYKNKN